jgi:hypothetical protein
MGYGVYEDGDRWAGYMVPGVCDATGCETKIDRGVSYKCEYHGDEYDGDGDEIENVPDGCGMFFCPAHHFDPAAHEKAVAKPDTPEWLAWMLTDDSWKEWRVANPKRVETMRSDPAVMDAMASPGTE